jgi:hypothetical protein
VNQILRPILVLLVLLGLAGCGDSSEDHAKARALLRDAFSKPIGSANVQIDLSADLDGNPQLQQPVRVKVSGPYRSNGDGKLPDADWDVSISGGGQTFTIGLLTTADGAYLEFQGQSYTLGDGIAKAVTGPPRGAGKGFFERLGVDPLEWVSEPVEEGDADVAGVPTRHVEGRIDVERTLRGLNEIVAKARTAVAGGPRAQLTDGQIEAASDAVDDPRFDAYVGKPDGKIRRVSIDLEFDVPEDSRRRVGGLEGGTVTLDVELAQVGQVKPVEPPKDARPIEELTKQLGGLGIFGALFGGAGPGGATGPAGPQGTPPTAEQLERYERCIDAAKPSDRVAIDRCAALLR